MQTSIDYKALYEEQVKIVQELTFHIQELVQQVAQFKKLAFGSKHERFIPSDPAKEQLQLALGLEVETAGECKITDVKKITYLRTKTEVTKNTKPHPGRTALPSNLRREIILLTPETDTSKLKKIGEEITEVLDLIPGEFYVKQYIRSKYVVPVSDTNTTVITASLPERVMEKSMFGEGVIAQILVDKYCDHLPLYRQLPPQKAGLRG